MEYVPQTCIIQFFPAIEVQDSFQSHFLAVFPVVIIPMACFFRHKPHEGLWTFPRVALPSSTTPHLGPNGWRFLPKNTGGCFGFPIKIFLLGQWLNFKLFGISYLGGKISRSNFVFQGPLAKWVDGELRKSSENPAKMLGHVVSLKIYSLGLIYPMLVVERISEASTNPPSHPWWFFCLIRFPWKVHKYTRVICDKFLAGKSTILWISLYFLWKKLDHSHVRVYWFANGCLRVLALILHPRNFTLPPQQLTWQWEITIFNRRYIFIHGCFSIVILVFGTTLKGVISSQSIICARV